MFTEPKFYHFSPNLKMEKVGGSFWTMKVYVFDTETTWALVSLHWELGNNPLEEQKMKEIVEIVEMIEIVRQSQPATPRPQIAW